jgi:hypothetical protein
MAIHRLWKVLIALIQQQAIDFVDARRHPMGPRIMSDSGDDAPGIQLQGQVSIIGCFI